MMDSFVFKKLAHNDTADAAGHQGGILIPKDIAAFFPPLLGVPSPGHPTSDIHLSADLFVNDRLVAHVRTRYQHQTWGGTRAPERRLTDNLGSLRNQARKDDIILFSKDLFDDTYIQARLITQGTEEYLALDAQIGNQRWGVLDPDNPPVTSEQIKVAEREIELESPESAFAPSSRERAETRTMRRARDRAFRNLVLNEYNSRCAITSRGLFCPVTGSAVGIDAAHIVPVNASGSDHPSNGLPMTKELHGCFDRGLFGVNEARRVVVPASVAGLTGNEFLQAIEGRRIPDARNEGMSALDAAFEWHRDNILLK